MSGLDSRQWGQLAQAIREGRCLIFLGPGATVNYGNPNSYAAHCEELANRNPQAILAFHAGDGFLVFKDSKTRSLYDVDMQKFYKGQGGNAFLEKLAAIPFHTVISVTPDNAFRSVFDQLGLTCFDQYYVRKRKDDLSQSPTASVPLIYNLFGSIKDSESLIYTHLDLFECIKSIFADQNLPDKLSAMFSPERTRSIVLLGFEFDKWYFQLILFILGIKIDACWRYAVAQSLPTSENRTLIESQFEIEFVVNDIDGFIHQLTAQFSPEELRKPGVPRAAATKVNKSRVYSLLIHAYDAQEFEVMCMVHYVAVHRNFSPEMGQERRVAQLLDYVDRNGGYPELLDFAREHNPYQYEKWGPYYE